MNKNKAIKILQTQKSKIDSASGFNEVWKNDTLSYIGTFFGRDSLEFKYLESLDTNIKITRGSEFWRQNEKREPQINIEKRRKDAIIHLDNLIQQINNRGVPTNKSFSTQFLKIVELLINILKGSKL